MVPIGSYAPQFQTPDISCKLRE